MLVCSEVCLMKASLLLSCQGRFSLEKQFDKYPFPPTRKCMCLFCDQHLEINEQQEQQMKQAVNPGHRCAQAFKMLM